MKFEKFMDEGFDVLYRHTIASCVKYNEMPPSVSWQKLNTRYSNNPGGNTQKFDTFLLKRKSLSRVNLAYDKKDTEDNKLFRHDTGPISKYHLSRLHYFCKLRMSRKHSAKINTKWGFESHWE
jgi:hypothetical protein